ncbi:MAG: CHAT domain-containing protein [Limisphaerales bacterium]
MNTLVLKYSVHESLGKTTGVDPASRRVQLTWELHPNTGRVVVLGTQPEVCQYAILQDLSQQAVTALRSGYGAMDQCARPEDYEAGGSCVERSLRPLGRDLCGALFPREVIERLQSDRTISHLVFQHDPLLHWVPFDWVHLADDFVCFEYATGRQLLARVPAGLPPRHHSPGQPYRAFSLVDTLGDLKAEVRDQFNQFRAAWASAGRDGKIDFSDARLGAITPAAFTEALRSHDLVSLVLHHDSDPQPERTGFVLGTSGDGRAAQIFTARDFQAAFPAGALPPLVLLAICCRSGTAEGWEKTWGTAGEPMHWMVDAAQSVGVRSYLGTVTEIPSVPAPLLLPPFYKALLAGHSAGQSLRQARLALRKNPGNPLDGGTLLGLGYVLYGSPTLGCFCAGGAHRLDDGPSVLCEAPLAEGICCKAVCPEDGGYQARRCSEHWTPADLVCSAGHPVERAGALLECLAGDCHNTVCPRCSGYGQRLCWDHCCHQGHRVLARARKQCRDPKKLHPDERRSICPLDAGWLRGLCSECLEPR